MTDLPTANGTDTDTTNVNANTAHSAAPASRPLQPDWFAASTRPAGTEPDTRYGWLTQGQDVYIVKALNLTHTHTSHGATPLDYERKAIAALDKLQAPVAALWDEQAQPLPDGWLATRFGGLSLQRLSLPGTPAQHAGLPAHEQCACWVHFLERAQGMAVEGIIPIDLWAGNLVVPFTQGLSGQLKLNGVINIDHAHTVAAGWNMRRPPWLGHNMLRIPPELQSLLRKDQMVLLEHFARQGLPLVSTGIPPGASPTQVARTRALWLAYSEPQSLQKQVDAGKINAHHVIQYAVGEGLRTHGLPGLAPALQKKLQPVLARMMAKTARDRFPSVQQAAGALRAALHPVPLVGQVHYPPVGPDTLRTPPPPAPEPNKIVALPQRLVETLRRRLDRHPALPAWRQPLHDSDWPYIYLALGVGTAAGVMVLGTAWR